jgi:hypothetical protein
MWLYADGVCLQIGPLMLLFPPVNMKEIGKAKGEV